eukprot:2088071-Pleurochrysis_carterae.AAC.3
MAHSEQGFGEAAACARELARRSSLSDRGGRSGLHGVDPGNSSLQCYPCPSDVPLAPAMSPAPFS